MCGIAGFRSERTVERSTLVDMVEELRHRGPDSEGMYRSDGYQAGMRRLSINDVHGGDQPLFNEDKTVVLLYNGEIYNSPMLRRHLLERGHRFATHSDGEVICHLYEEYGEGLFEKLDGMFAAALWIVPEKRLILARDLPGEKPLYYARISEREIAFASEIRSLVRFPGLDRRLSPQALWDFPTFLWVPEPATVYEGIFALERGHLLMCDELGTRVRPYPNRFNQHPLPESHEEVVGETRRVVTEAIRSRLLSDVPVGSFLSSGLDSSIVATIAARELPELATFSVGFEDIEDPYHGRADESALAAEYSAAIGARHHSIRVTAGDFRRDLEVFCRHGDQPWAVSSGLGILAVARAAREAGIKVLLSGDGADECFGGYSWYAHLAAAEAPGPAIDPAASVVSFQNTGLSVEERLARLRALPGPERAWAWHYYAAEDEKRQLFEPDFFEGVSSSIRHFEAFRHADHWEAVDFIQQDREFYFPNEMLRKVDRMTMAYSVEGRVPFAAPAVLAHADKLKYSHMVRGDTLKSILREAFADVLPARVLTRNKHGFNVPIDHWLKNEWSDLVEETFSSQSFLRRLGITHSDSPRVAHRMLHDPLRLNGHTIFCFIMLELWLRETETSGNHC